MHQDIGIHFGVVGRVVVRVEFDQALVDGEETRCRIGDFVTGEKVHEETEVADAENARERCTVGGILQEPGSNDGICASCEEWFQHARYVLDLVLTVPVDPDDRGVSVFMGVQESGLNGSPDPQVARKVQDNGPGLSCYAGGRIRRSVVDDQYIIRKFGPQVRHDPADRTLFPVRGDGDQHTLPDGVREGGMPILACSSRECHFEKS